MTNRIVVVGWLGNRRCYLNVSRADAAKRYLESEGSGLGVKWLEENELINEFAFDDEFWAYDVGSP